MIVFLGLNKKGCVAVCACSCFWVETLGKSLIDFVQIWQIVSLKSSKCFESSTFSL